MLSILLLFMQVYLATVLGVSGLAKVVNPEQFAATLRRQRVLPVWSIKAVSRVVPWFEVVLALLLVLGIYTVPVNMLVLAVFVCFLVIEAILLTTKRSTECGCYGTAYRRQVDTASLVVSSLFAVLAGFNIWGTLALESVGLAWRLPAITVFGLGSLWLVSKTLQKQLRILKHLHNRRDLPLAPLARLTQRDKSPLA